METPAPNVTKEEVSEFAQKLPLIEKSFYKKLFRGLFLFVGIIVIVIGIAVFVATQMKKPVTETPKPPEPETPPEVVVPEIKYLFAYIKNGDSIFALADDFKEKLLIAEVPVSADGIYTAISWKEPKVITYSKCLSVGAACEIFSYDIINNSLKPELVSAASRINSFEWSPDRKYIAYISEEGGQTNLRFKSGTIDTILKGNPLSKDTTNTYSKVLFTDDGQFIAFSSLVQKVVGGKDNEQLIASPVLYVFRINGIQIDFVANASDPFFIDNKTIGYKKDGKLIYKTIGDTGESEIASFIGYNPQVSPSGESFAYWSNENNGLNVVLGVYDSKLNIHRNILRGIILPTWISQDKIAGIKADSCLGENCLLYQFQTASLSIVDISNGEVTPVDQAKSISNITFNRAN